MDIGGHRFFSKSDWVMNWWREILPIAADAATVEIAYHGQRREIGADGTTAARRTAESMLVRRRLSRIYFLRKYFDYPIKLNATTLRISVPCAAPDRPQLFSGNAVSAPPRAFAGGFPVNRFGGELYRTFFKDYTEKVWGVPCDQISAEWGAQRIKGLSVIEALRHALRRRFGGTAQATQHQPDRTFSLPAPRAGPDVAGSGTPRG
jgi:hypothetical protein